jgi:Fic family protein
VKLNEEYRQNRKHLSEVIIQKEMERLIIELSWKSSQIEGNTYSLLETESLIKEHKEARGHKREEALMILNHKNALDYIVDDGARFKKLSVFEDRGYSSAARRGIEGIKRPSQISGRNYRYLL